MPFKSKEQERYLQINEPEIYRDWVEKYGHFKGAESFEDFKRILVGDGWFRGDTGYMEGLEEYYEEYLEDFTGDNPESFEDFQERILRVDYENEDFKRIIFGAEPDTIRFKVGERYTPLYYHGYGHSDIEIIRRTDKSVFVAQVDAQGNAAGNTLRYKIHTTPAVDMGGDRFPAQEYYKLTHGQPVRAGDTTKKAESFGAEDGYECSNCGSHELRYREYDNPEHNGFFCMNCGQSPCGINEIDNKPCTCDIMEYGQYTWLGEMPRTQFPSYIDVEAFKKQEQDKENERIRIVGSKKKLDAIRKAESFRSYKVAPDLSSYTKAELVSSIAGPQGTAAYDEVVYDPLAQSRLSAESIDSFSPARLIILGASIGVALGLYNTRGE